ncbi:MAG TPA: hypothetical protein VJL84_02470 [Kiloniellales bacterium]|nr:hypothetical protein [Kiloniellales bacterium]
MTQQPPKALPPRGNNTLMIVAAAVVVVALAVGAYFLFVDRGGGAGGGAVSVSESQALVGGGEVGDIKAFLEKSIGPENLAKATYTLDGNSLKDVSIPTPEGKEMKIKEIKFLALDTEHPEPHFMDVRLSGFEAELPPDQIPGVSKVSGDIVYAYEFDPAAKTLSIPHTEFNFPGLTRFTISGKFIGVEQMGGATPEEAMSGMAGAKIEDLRIVWSDEKLLRAMLEQTAQSQGMTLDELKTAAQAALPVLKQQMTGDLEKEVLDAAETAIKKVDNVTLTVIADPAEPFPLAAFLALAMSPTGMPDFNALKPLNLTIEAE